MVRRFRPRLGFLLVILLAAVLPLIGERVMPRLAFNHTSSMPRGFYWRSPVPVDGLRRGDLVIACAPTTFARFGRASGFLDVGPCDGVTTLLKRVVGIAGDRVHLDAHGVTVNGTFVPGSRPVALDNNGRSVPHVAYGNYVLAANDVWLLSPRAKSFDSRYFGPVSTVLSIAQPLLVEGSEIAE